MSEKVRKNLVAAVTWLLRLAVGGVFIFSGFVKAVDPWGSFYKFQEYFAAMGIPAMHNLLVAGVFGLCALEFLIGVFLVLGCYRRSAPVLALAFMCVMLPLTLWIAVKNPVTDCGCFGDYLVISNWATFWKNIVLTAMIAWLLKFNTRYITIISPAFQWIVAVFSFCFIIAVAFVGYAEQPLLDFRPYPVGSALVSDDGGDDAERFVFIYEKDGETREFGEDDDLPSEEDGWKFVERREIKQDKERASAGKTLRIWNRAGDEDVTDDVLGDGRMLILLIPDMTEVSPATTWKINALNQWASARDAEMIAVVSGTSEQIADWEDLSMPDYEIYTSDDTAIKEVARGNPAVLSLVDGQIEWKSTLAAMQPEESDIGLQFSPALSVVRGHQVMLGMFWLYLAFMAFPLALTFMPRIRSCFKRPHS